MTTHLVTPPRWPLLGLGLMKARMSLVSSGILVLSPRMLPPVAPLLGSTARTATLCPASVSFFPKISANHSDKLDNTKSIFTLLEAFVTCEGTFPGTRGSGQANSKRQRRFAKLSCLLFAVNHQSVDQKPGLGAARLVTRLHQGDATSCKGGKHRRTHNVSN